MPTVQRPDDPRRPARRARPRPPRPRRLCLEPLEPRWTLAADLTANIVAELLEEAPEQMAGVPFYLARLRADGSFNDLNYRGNSDASARDIMEHGQRLEVLALAWRWNDPGNPYANSTVLRGQIVKGFEYLAQRAGSIAAPNWWWQAVGVPSGIAEGLLLMRSELAASVRNQILGKYFGSVWQPWKMDGANLAYQAPPALIDGLLRGDSGRVRSVVSELSRELAAYSGEGIQRDLAFLQHRLSNKYNYYSGSYGLVFASQTARVMRWVSGTPYAFAPAAIDHQTRFVLDGLAWLTRGDALDLPSQGRSITRPGSITTAPWVLYQTYRDLVPLGRRTEELVAAMSRYETGITPENALRGFKVFWTADAAVWQRPGMMATVKLLSSRTLRPETAAGENTRGFFLGDGFTMLVQDGDEFGRRGQTEVIPVWNWQRLPGTTVAQTGSIPYYDMFKTAQHSTGQSDLVGGVSDGRYGLAAMEYRRSGVSVQARKAWFFFDNELVALGADIRDPAGNASVFTTLNQVLLDGPVTLKDAAGTQTLRMGSLTLRGPAWVEHDRLGYVNLDPAGSLTVQASLQTGGGVALPVFSAWVDHGVRPAGASYAYAVVPQATHEQLDAFLSDPPVAILANTAAVQAVAHRALGQTQIVFYAPGSVRLLDGTLVRVTQPASLIVAQQGSTLQISAADPRQAATSLTVEISLPLAGNQARWIASQQVTQIVLPLPSGAYRGASVTQTFQRLDQVPAPLAVVPRYGADGEHGPRLAAPALAVRGRATDLSSVILPTANAAAAGPESIPRVIAAPSALTPPLASAARRGASRVSQATLWDALAVDAAMHWWAEASEVPLP
jgi:chondroitin AC lyase